MKQQLKALFEPFILYLAIKYFSFSFQRIDLYNFADLLLKLGFVNAINLDGGGSATMVINNTVVNYPSDKW